MFTGNVSERNGRKAGRGNRTLVFSLEGYCSTIELHPRDFRTRKAAESDLPTESLKIMTVDSGRTAERSVAAQIGQWGVQDSNLRRQSHQIYSLTPLAAWVTPRVVCGCGVCGVLRSLAAQGSQPVQTCLSPTPGFAPGWVSIPAANSTAAARLEPRGPIRVS